MKKISIFLSTALFLLLFASCNSNDSLIDKYEKAINEGNYSEATEILSKIDQDELTTEQSMRIINISTGGASEKLFEAGLQTIHELGSTFDEEFTDEYVDMTERAGEKALEESMDAYMEALSDYVEE